MKTFEEFTVNEIITADFRAGTVFKKFGIDPALNKGKTLYEVCYHFNLDSDTILDKIIDEMEVKVQKPYKMTA